MGLFWVDTLDLAAFKRQLDRIEYRLKTLTQQGISEMATLEAITAEVRRTAGVAASIKVAVDGLKARIAELEALIAAGGTDQAAIDALQVELDAANDVLELVTAVEANPTARK